MISNELKMLRTFLIALLIGLLLTACGGGGSGDSAVSSSASTVSSSGVDQGTLQLALVDASSGSYKAVYVTIARVEVHLGGEEDALEEETAAGPSPRRFLRRARTSHCPVGIPLPRRSVGRTHSHDM